MERTTSQGWTYYEHKVTKKIEWAVPPKSSSSHTPALVPTLTSVQHQWIDTLSADYNHPVESAQLTFNWSFTNTLHEWYGFLNSSDTSNIPIPKKAWKFITKNFRHPLSIEKINALHKVISLFLSNMLKKTPPPSFMWDIGKDCGTLLTEACQDSPFQVLPMIIEGHCHYMVSSKIDSTVPWVLEFQDPATVLQYF